MDDQFLKIIREIELCQAVSFMPQKGSVLEIGAGAGWQAALACGKAVIISKTKGFWNRKDFIDGEHLFFVEGDEEERWCEMIFKLTNNKDKAETIGRNGRRLLSDKYDIVNFGQKLELELQESLGK